MMRRHIEDSGAVQRQRQKQKQKQKQKEDKNKDKKRTAKLYKKKNKNKNKDENKDKNKKKTKTKTKRGQRGCRKRKTGTARLDKNKYKNKDKNENKNENKNKKKKKKDIQMHARNFRDFSVWQESVNYCTTIYQLCGTLPWFEKKGLGDQLQRAAVSIPSNIAEGAGRPSDSDFAHFLDMALSSAYEVETQLIISNKIGYIDENKFGELYSGIQTIERQLLALIRSIRTPQP